MSNNRIPDNQSDYPFPPGPIRDHRKRGKKHSYKNNKYGRIVIAIIILAGVLFILKSHFDNSQKETGVSSNNIAETDTKSSNKSEKSGRESSHPDKDIVMTVDPLPTNKLIVDRYSENSLTIDPTTIDSIDGALVTEDQEDSYSFIPEIDGIYRFEFSNIPNDVNHSLYLYNSEHEELKRNTNIGNGNGITEQLSGGHTYELVIKQGWNTGSYTLTIGHQKPRINVSDYTQISDSIQFTDQENDYVYIPDIDGEYRFEFSDIPNNINHSIFVYNSEYEELDRNTNIGNENGVTISLKSGQEYHIVVRQAWNVGSYKLNIGKPKPLVDITDYSTVSDSIQYTDQQNLYEFIPKIGGVYRFEFANIPNNISHSIYVYNNNYEELDKNTGGGNGDGITISLDAGESYFICIKQSWNTGSYDLLIGTQKEYKDITGIKTVIDSIQYTDQENVYMYKSEKSGDLTLSFSDIADNASLSLSINNNQMEELDNYTGIENNDEIVVPLETNSNYFIIVKQDWGVCDYKIDVQ